MSNSSPNVPQGTLNLLRPSVLWVSYPQLNVSAGFLAKAMLTLAFEGDFTTEIEVQTGLVQSPEPYVATSITMNLLRTQPLAAQYQLQWLANTVLGDCTVRGDVAGGSGGLSSFYLNNCAIKSVRELSFAGKDPSLVVMCRGYYNVNANLYNS